MSNRIMLGMGHPAHFHLFRELIELLKINNYEIKIVITDKDILAHLLDEHGLAYQRLGERKNKENLIDKALKVFRTTFVLRRIVKSFRPQIMIGTLSQMAYAGKLERVPFYFFGEDDITYTFLQCYITYPFVTNMVAPTVTNVGVFRYKKVAYNGYQKLAYLHPNRFKPNPELIPEIDVNSTYAIVRLVDLNAYHDVNINGIDMDFLRVLIGKLSRIGKVYLSSENELPNEFEKYKLPVSVKYMHHALAYATVFVGDSQSMTVEAAVLGIPALKFNDFNGKISVLNELESKYGLTYGFNTSQKKELLSKIDELIETNELKAIFTEKRQLMLNQKLDVTAFMFEFVEEKIKNIKYKLQ